MHAWLAELKLERYGDAIRAAGYDELEFFVTALESDLEELAAEIGMKRPHARALVVGWKKLVANGGALDHQLPEPEPELAAENRESHGQAVQVMQPTDEFDFVFSNKTASDALCLQICAKLTAQGIRVWQQKTNIPKDSDNWFNEWFPSAVKSRKIVCFISADYLKSPYCMKEFGIALASHKLLVVACEPLAAINAVDPSAYPHASNALAYLLGGGQVIFHGTDDVVAEILKFVQ